MRLAGACLAVLLWTSVCEAQDTGGPTIADVRVEIGGTIANDRTIAGLIETHIGEPLSMQDVRATIDHLVGLGRFDDVRVLSTPSAEGVALVWQLAPVTRVARIKVDGRPAIAEAAIRSELSERFGLRPSSARVPDIVTALRAFYASRGYPHATITPRVDTEDTQPEQSTLVLAIESGDRVRVGAASVTGHGLDAEAEVLRAVAIRIGEPFDQAAIDARLAKYEETLRDRGFYEARVRESHVPMGDPLTVALSISVEPGPHVSVVFAGDPLPSVNRNALVPIREDRSVDQDLLDDASARIENALKETGYRDARAPYTRAQQGSELVITFTIARGPLYRIGSVDTAGHQSLTRADLAPVLQIKSGEAFVDGRVGLVASALTELYRVRGFAQADVKAAIDVQPETASGGVPHRPVAVRFDIEEGPQTIVTGVTVDGTSAIAAESLRAMLALQAGKPFYRPQLGVDRDTIERAYRNQGFQAVSVISQLAFANDQQGVALTWTIREGEQITIDHVLISGHRRISADLIRRELTFHPGGPVSDDAMLESQRQLASLGLFRRVRIAELPRSGSLSRDILVEVDETETTTVDYGGGLEVGRIAVSATDGSGATDALDVGPRGFFAISRRNLWGKNRSVTLFGRVTLRREALDPSHPDTTGGYGFNDYRGLFTFREPRAFGTTGDSQFTAFVEQGRRSSFSFNRRGITADYARRVNAFTVTYRYTYDYTQLFDEQIEPADQLLIDRLFPQVRLSKVYAGILRDSRDDVLDPQRGAVVGIDGSLALRALGSEVGFVKTFAQGFVYRRLPGKGFVLAAGARLGMAVGIAQAVPPPIEIAAAVPPEIRPAYAAAAAPLSTVIRDLPASERFFAGGDTTVRGFALDRLGTEQTLDPQGFPQGGNGMLIFNVETRAPYWKGVQMVWFLDAGNVYKRVSDITLGELRFSSGVGFRYRSPIGPLRIDWGWKLSTRLVLTGGRERSNIWHISLGQAF